MPAEAQRPDAGVTVDPARLREAAGRLRAQGAGVLDVAAAVRATLLSAGPTAAPRLAEALAAFDRELTARSQACADALGAAAVSLASSADEAELGDRAAGGAIAGPGPT